MPGHTPRKRSMKKPAQANVGTRTGGFPRKSPAKRTTKVKMKKKY